MRIWKKDTHMIVTPRIRAMADAMPGDLLRERRVADVHQQHRRRAVVVVAGQQVRLAVDVELRDHGRHQRVHQRVGQVRQRDVAELREAAGAVDGGGLVLSCGTLASALW